MSSRAETVAVADDVWEELLKYVVLAVSKSPEQSYEFTKNDDLTEQPISAYKV